MPESAERLILGTWSETDEGFEVRAGSELSQTQYDTLAQDTDALDRCSTNVFFRALQDNKAAWDGLVTVLDSRRQRRPNQREFTPNGRVLGRRFLVTLANFLSAARTYFDATSSSLSANFGKDSALFQEFESSRHDQYDRMPAYRFCEQLRNAIQHTASIPLRIEVSRTDVSMTHRLVCRREELIRSDFGWKAQVKRDLAAGPEEIDIARSLDIYWGCIVVIEQQRVIRQLAHVRPAIERLSVALREAGVPADRPSVLLRLWSDAAGATRLEPRPGPVPLELERYLRLIDEDRLDELFGSSSAPTVDESQLHRVNVTPEAESILRAWLLSGPTEANRAIETCVRSPEAAANAVAGLVNVAGVAMSQIEVVLGLSALDMLDSFVAAEASQDANEQ